MRCVRLGILVLLVLTVVATSAVPRAQALTAPMVGTGVSGPATADAAATYHNPAMLGYLERGALLGGGILVAGDVRYRRERRGVYQRADSLDFALPVDPGAVDPGKTGFTGRCMRIRSASLPGSSERIRSATGWYWVWASTPPLPPHSRSTLSQRRASFCGRDHRLGLLHPGSQLSRRRASERRRGVSYVLGFAEMSRVQDFAALADVGNALARPPIDQANDFGPNAPTGVRELDVMARPIAIRNAWSHAATFNIGFASRPVDGLSLGLSYQHRVPMHFRGKFTLNMDDDFFAQDLASQGLQYPRQVEGNAEIAFPLPGSVRLGATWDVTPRVGVGANLAYTFWSDVQDFRVTVQSAALAQPKIGLPDRTQIDLPRRWMNTIGADIVVRFTATDRIRLWAPLGYRSSATPDATMDVASLDGDRFVVGLGGEVRVAEAYALVGDAMVQTMVPRHVVGSENDIGNGEYHFTLWAFGVSVRISAVKGLCRAVSARRGVRRRAVDDARHPHVPGDRSTDGMGSPAVGRGLPSKAPPWILAATGAPLRSAVTSVQSTRPHAPSPHPAHASRTTAVSKPTSVIEPMRARFQRLPLRCVFMPSPPPKASGSALLRKLRARRRSLGNFRGAAEELPERVTSARAPRTSLERRTDARLREGERDDELGVAADRWAERAVLCPAHHAIDDRRRKTGRSFTFYGPRASAGRDRETERQRSLVG